MRCVNCGYKIRNSYSRYCGRCGCPLPLRRHRSWPTVVITLFVSAFVVVGALFVTIRITGKANSLVLVTQLLGGDASDEGTSTSRRDGGSSSSASTGNSEQQTKPVVRSEGDGEGAGTSSSSSLSDTERGNEAEDERSSETESERETDAGDESETAGTSESAHRNSLYSILDHYKEIADAGWTEEALESHPEISEQASRVSSGYRAGYSAAPTIGYAFIDLNGNGKEELVMSCAGENIGAGGKAECIFDVWSNDSGTPTAPMMYIQGPGADKGLGMYGYIQCTDGCLAIRLGKTNAEVYYYRLPTGGGTAQYDEGWNRLRDANYTDARHFFYYSIDADGNATEMSEDEYDAMRSRHGYYIDGEADSYYEIIFQPLSEYEN